jgi:4'-phosphopantetheinyl transferase
MDVYWLEQTEADVPAENQWLCAREVLCLAGLRYAKRRTDWRLGRWTAKRALAASLNLPTDFGALANIEIRAAPTGAPEVYLLSQPASVTISLSHRAGAALCAVALHEASLGCDLEMVEPRSSAFVADYFTANEQALVQQKLLEERPLLVTLLWSAKESALKALHLGLRLDTRCMDVSPVDSAAPHAADDRQNPYPVSLLAPVSDGWCPLQVRYAGDRVFRGWWRQADHLVRTVVYDLPVK